MVGGRSASVVLVGLLGVSVPSVAPLRPDLVETRVSVSQHDLRLEVRDTVRDRGQAAAPPSTTGYYLGHVRIGGRLVRGLGSGTASHGAKTLTIARSVAPGSYRLRACADDRKRIREHDERNNCRAAPQAVLVPDLTPPAFAGLKQATTCLPGPVGGSVRYSHYSLRWLLATDDVSAASEIVYDIYQATAPAAEDFSKPTYTTEPGADSFATPLLPDDKSYYFVVRARDTAGNRDANSVERPGQNICL
jgi:hypothetical protein